MDSWAPMGTLHLYCVAAWEPAIISGPAIPQLKHVRITGKQTKSHKITLEFGNGVVTKLRW